MIDKVFFEKLESNLGESLRVISANKIRTFLTMLGVIFGVAAVIAMLAIGNGAEKEILDQLKLVGVNNIVIKSIPDTKTAEQEDSDKVRESKRFSKGLDLLDMQSVKEKIPSVKRISPEIILDAHVLNKGRQSDVKVVGVAPSFFEISNIEIDKGKNFSEYQAVNALPVCIIGKKIEKKIFAGESAIGKNIKVKNIWLRVIGVIEEKFISDKARENLGMRDVNQDIYIPVKTFLVRFKNRKAIIEKNPLSEMFMGGGVTSVTIRRSSGPKKRTPRGNYHQIDKLTVQVSNSNELDATSEVLSRMLKRKHNDILDFEITIPIHLLKQQKKTKEIFNIVLSIIAGISLLIGGIGIMNIMLASVLERTKEIGVMRAIGATRQDVILKFLSESILISVGGGIIGIAIGIAASYIIEAATGIQTILTLKSIMGSFFVAILIGLIFGITPARTAANKNPIESLRHE